MSPTITIEQGIRAAGVGRFQYRLFVIFGLVWLADAMQVLSIGFTAPSIAATFGIPVPTALQTGTMFFVGMLIGAFMFGRLADPDRPPPRADDGCRHRRHLRRRIVVRPGFPSGCWCCAS
ncbi:hypothetical protein ACTMU2_25090 [Cupriavidus basilensis]